MATMDGRRRSARFTLSRSAASRGARFLWANTLYLRPGTKEHFLSFVDEEPRFPT